MKFILSRPLVLGLLTAGLALVPVFVGWRDYHSEARLREAQLFGATGSVVGERLQLMAARHFSAFPIIRNQLRAQGGARGEPVVVSGRIRASLPHLSAIGYASEDAGRVVLRWLAFGDGSTLPVGEDLSNDPHRKEVLARASRQPTPSAGADGTLPDAVFVAEAVGDHARPTGFVVGWLDLKSLCADPTLPFVGQGILSAEPAGSGIERGENKLMVIGEGDAGVPVRISRGPGFAAAYGEVTPWVVLVSGAGCAGLLGFLASQGARTARLRQALAEEKLRVRMVQTFSHEFKTPLSVILSSADLMEAGADSLGSQRRTELIAQIRDSTNGLSSMVTEMLFLSRLESGMFTSRPELLDLEAFCAGLAREFESAARMENRVVVDARGNARLDPTLLRALLGNMLGNALKYSPGKFPVRLDASIGAEGLIIVVSDSGIGIPPDALDRVGEPFFRANNTHGISGSGLGLAIARRAATVLGGTLVIASEQGKGTTATFKMPKP